MKDETKNSIYIVCLITYVALIGYQLYQIGRNNGVLERNSKTLVQNVWTLNDQGKKNICDGIMGLKKKGDFLNFLDDSTNQILIFKYAP